MKNIVNEELNYMKYLFGYQRGKVISEQPTKLDLEKDGCEKGFYRNCTTKECIKKPKNTIVVYSQEDFDKYKKAVDIAKKRNNITYNFIKKNGDIFKLADIPISSLEHLIITTVKKPGHTFPYKESKRYNKKDDENLGLVRTGRWWNPRDPYVNPQFGLLEYKILNPILGCLEIPTTEPVETPTTEPVKIKNINQITKVEDFPKEFILYGTYRCDGTSGLGNSSQKSTFEQQCMNLPQNLKTNQRLASWEIKFPPNVAGNPNTVPVTRWNFIWNSEGKITEVKMQNFNKIGEKEQIVYNNLLKQKTSSENLKAFMKIAYGDDTYYKNNVGNFM